MKNHPLQRTVTRPVSAVAMAPASSARRFPVPGGLLLLDQSANTLFAYNDVARAIWDEIEAGRSPSDIAATLAAQCRIPAARARRDVGSIVALWRRQGLLAGAPRRAKPADVMAAFPRPRGGSSGEWVCTIRGVTIAFAIEAALRASVRALYAHLETPGAAPQVRLAVVALADGAFALIENGEERVRVEDAALAIGALSMAVLERVRPGVRWLALMHGAALARAGRGVALVGPSGSGKSTLAAGLLSAGFTYYADDLVALSEPHAAIVPWPLPVSVKPGSVDALAPRLPGLKRMKRYRTKGMMARLLVPPAAAWDAPPAGVAALLFPRFAEGAAAQARRLSSFEALQLLLADRVWLGDPITAPRVAAFLAWLDRTPAYALSYGGLDDGINLVESVL